MDAGGPILISEEARLEARRHGQHLYRLGLTLEKDIRGRKRSLSAFVKHLSSVGKVVAIRPTEAELDAMPPGTDTPFVVVVASVLDATLAPMGLALDAARIQEIDLDDMRPVAGLAAAAAPAPAAAPAAAPQVEAPKPAAPTPTLVPVDGAAAPGAVDVKRGANGNEALRVKTSLLDRLMQMAGELVLARNRLLRRLDGERDRIEGLGTLLGELNGITSEIQEQIMRTRLQPLGSIFGRFSRVMHDMSEKLNKSVRLDTVGGDVELDKTLLEGLTDPLMHMIRNSIDHGIEGPDEREMMGKPRQGTVRIRAYHEGGLVNIDVEDDGRGIDVAKVKAAAVKKGILTPEQAERMSEGDALSLVFKPGFSTASKVTDISGRGVGMDVVRINIEKLGGMVEISTKLGQGSRVTIKLPLTLAIVTSLIVEVEGQRFALPQVGLESVVRLKPDEVAGRIERIRDMDVLRYRDRLLPIVRLADVLGMERTFVHPETGERMPDKRQRLSDRRARLYKAPAVEEEELRVGKDRRSALANVLRILVLRIGRNSYGLMVDRIVENEEIVVKPLSRFLRDSQCFSGATILGDGTIAMILDPVGIALRANLKFNDLSREVAEESAAERRRALRERVPLIHFSDGGPETFALPLAQVSRVEKIATREVQRIGSREYINYRGKALPLVRLHDYLNVAATLEEPEEIKVIIPRLGGELAGIVTHQVIDAREVDLEVDQSTIGGQGIMGSAIFDGEIVLVLDTYGLMEAAGVATTKRGVGAMQGRRVLLADDTPFMALATERYLSQAGLEVHTVDDGLAAWEALQEGEYDVVITDLRMPELDGHSLFARMQSHDHTARVPVIALTDDASAADGFAAFAPKLDHAELMAALAVVFEQHQEVAA